MFEFLLSEEWWLSTLSTTLLSSTIAIVVVLICQTYISAPSSAPLNRVDLHEVVWDALNLMRGQLSSEHSNLSKEHSNLSKEHSSLSDKLSAEHTTLNTALTEIKAQASFLHDDVLKRDQRVNQLNQIELNTKDLIEHVSALQTGFENLKLENAQLKGENLSLKNERDSLRQDVARLTLRYGQSPGRLPPGQDREQEWEP